MTKNIPQTQPILFKNILKKEEPVGHILFSEVLQMENGVPNIGAVSSSFYPSEESEVEFITPEEKIEDASMDFDQKLYDRMEEEGLLDDQTYKPKVKSTNDSFRW